MKYRKKPVVIDAERFQVLSVEPNEMFMQWPIQKDEKGAFLIIPTLEGNHRAENGDWIIKGVAGEFYPCKPDIFEKTYEPVEE